MTIFKGGGKRIYFGELFFTLQTIIYSSPGLIVIFFLPQPFQGLFKV